MEQIEPFTLKHSLTFGLRSLRLEALRRRLTDAECEQIIGVIFQRLELCGWEVWHERPASFSVPPTGLKK
jgi:hypothetical protein